MRHYELDIDIVDPDEESIVKWMQQHGDSGWTPATSGTRPVIARR